MQKKKRGKFYLKNSLSSVGWANYLLLFVVDFYILLKIQISVYVCVVSQFNTYVLCNL